MKKKKSHSINYDGADFNADYAATRPLQDFIAENAHLWPRKTEQERTEALTRVHQLATEAVVTSAMSKESRHVGNYASNKPLNDGNSSSDASEAGSTETDGGTGGSDTGDIGGSGGVDTGATVSKGRKGGRE